MFGIVEGTNVIEAMAGTPMWNIALEKSRKFVEEKTWDVPAKQMDEKIRELVNDKA